MRFRRLSGRVPFLLILLGVLVAFIALPAIVIYTARQFHRGPISQLVTIERSFFGVDDSYDVDYVELLIDARCIQGLDSSGATMLLVFENDESVQAQDGELTVGPVMHWPRETEEWSPAALSGEQIGYARSGDIVAIDLHFEQGQISRWKTRPYTDCVRENVALVSPD